jgi:hypothetical protein
VAAQGPQTLLQQAPQSLPHFVPSCEQLPVPVVPGSWHVPSVAPEARLQYPLQQSVSRPQTSPGWMHQEAPSTQTPPLHSPEQQLLPPPSAVPHGLPAVAQLVLSGWHFEPAQFPLQQDPELEQLWLSATQVVAVAHFPAVVSHWRLQQSVATAHELPVPEQWPTAEVQVCAVGSQAAEQHWPSAVQDEPGTPHTTFDPPVPGPPPPCPPAPVFSALTLFPQPDAASASASETTSDRMIVATLSGLMWARAVARAERLTESSFWSHPDGEWARGTYPGPYGPVATLAAGSVVPETVPVAFGTT